MKIFYAYSEKDLREINRMRGLLRELLAGAINKSEFDTEMRRIKAGHLLEGRTGERRSQRRPRNSGGQERLV